MDTAFTPFDEDVNSPAKPAKTTKPTAPDVTPPAVADTAEDTKTVPVAGTIEAETAPGSNNRKTNDQKVLAQYDTEVQKLEKLRAQVDRAQTVVDRLRPEFDSKNAYIKALRLHPAVVRAYGPVENVNTEESS